MTLDRIEPGVSMLASLIAAFYFFYFAIIAVYIIFMPKVLSMVGYLPSEIGIIFAAAPLVRFIVPFAFTRGLQLNRTIFNTALALMLLSSITFFPALHSFTGLLLTNIGLGIGLSLILPYIEVIALSEIGKERYGKIRLFGSIGFITVALVLVRFMDSPETAIGYLAITTLLTAIFGFIIARHDHHQPSRPTQQGEGSPLQIIAHWPLWLGLGLMQVSFGPFYNFFTIYETAHGVSLDMTIYLWSFGVVVEILMLYFQGPLLKKNLLTVLQVTTAVTVFRWMLVWLFPDNMGMLFFSQGLHALSFALFHSAAISYLFTLYSEQKLAQQFFFGISYGLGGFLGAVSSGYIYEWWPEQLFLSAAIIAFASFVSLKRAEKISPKNPLRDR